MTTSGLLPSFSLNNPDLSFRALNLGQSKTSLGQAGAPGSEVQQEPLGLAADIDYDVQDGELRIQVAGPLDVRCTSPLLAIGQAVDESIIACRLCLEGVTRVFDSGIAALLLLAKAMTRKGIRMRIEGLDLDRPSLSPYRNRDHRGSVPAYLRRVFTWSAPSLLDTDPLVMPIKIPAPRPYKV